MSDQLLIRDHAQLTVKCPVQGCDELVTRIERYHVTVEWNLETAPVAVGARHPISEPKWTLGAHDSGTHFHLFCADGHESKRWGNQLPKRLQAVVYPGNK